jgi:DNA-binding transcriptional LysR family regulator
MRAPTASAIASSASSGRKNTVRSPIRPASSISFLSVICDRHGFIPRYTSTEASSLPAIVGLVAAGDGISIMSATTHTLPRDGVAVVPIEDEHMPLALAWRAGDQPPAIEGFRTLTRAHVSG